MTNDKHAERARELRDYIDARYHEMDEDEIDGHQLVALTEGSILKALRQAAADEREAILRIVQDEIQAPDSSAKAYHYAAWAESLFIRIKARGTVAT